MEEKILVEGKPNAKTIPMVLIGASLFVFLLGVIIDWSPSERLVPYLISTVVLIAGIVLYFAWRVSSITVSNKRVYGKALFGSRVDIPLDSVSVVGTVGLVHGISVSSSSGKLSFAYISNNDEIHKILCEIVMNRSNAKETTIINPYSSADELKKYKGLLDQGVISKEEFDAKKKQLLGL